ncbi:MAG: HNH/ENDO VII family nuclease, partial [Lachnospiraceae bacterium]|nr:HNH/ENDO VII family nuclease [Lachnospiraceae bacterium]
LVMILVNSPLDKGHYISVREIDFDFVDKNGRTNLQRMQMGRAALDPITGQPYQLHHIGQEMDSTLAMLTKAEHMQNGNNLIWHQPGGASKIDRQVFESQRKEIWKAIAKKGAK